MAITDNHTEICFGLRHMGSPRAERAADLIEQQASRIKQQAQEYVSLFDQCSEALDRVKALEAKCALLAASLAQEDGRSEGLEVKFSLLERARETDPVCVKWYAWQHDFDQERIVELESKVASAERATRFAGLVLARHRNDGYPGDLDSDFLQSAALECGLIEERTMTGPCDERCSCAEVLSESEFPTVCYFNTGAGKAAIEASKKSI